MKKRRACLLLGCVLSLCLAGAALAAPQEPDAIATVNGIPLAREEYELAVAQCRGDVISYFRETCGAPYGEDFWETAYGGETPSEMLHRRALAQCTYWKTVQSLALEHGLTDDISYAAFLSGMEAENARRKADIAAGRVVYGVAEYTPETHYAYVNSNLALALKRELESGPLASADGELDAWFTSHGEEFRIPDTLELRSIAVPRSDRRQIEEAAGALAGGAAFEAVAEQYGGARAFTLDNATRRAYAKYDEVLYQAAMELQEGGVSPVLDVREGYALVYCVRRIPGAVPPLAAVEEEARQRFLDEQFDTYLMEQYEEAEVKWLT